MKTRTPERRCMPLSEWPAPDRTAWHDASRTGGLLDEHGLASRWRPATQRYVIEAYGRYLTFLERNGWLDRDAEPDQRVTLERLRPYVALLMNQVAPATVAGRIRGLAEAVRVMVPGASYPFLNRARQRLKTRARPSRNKRARIVPIQNLFQLGLQLMHHAENGEIARNIWRAVTYRDGLIILLMACRPLRARNVVELTLGRHFVERDGAYHLAIPGTETKNHRDYNSALDPLLTPFIDRYIHHHRPMLLGSAEDSSLWIFWGGGRITSRGLYGLVVMRTTQAFGHSVCPHLFRDCAVTSLGEQDPDHVWIGMQLLHHADPRTTEKHYDQALSDHAVRRYQDTVRAVRRAVPYKSPAQ